MADSKGEGSRGGKIIRHTKGGYPVYDSSARERVTKAVGLAGAGVTFLHAAKEVSGRAEKAIDKLHTRSFRLKKLAAKANRGAISRVAKFRLKNNLALGVLEHLHEHGKHEAIGIGATLLGAAATSAVEGTKYDTKNTRRAITGASVVGAFALMAKLK